MDKNILIVNSSSIYANNATGITLRSIFKGLDSEKLMEVFWVADNSEHELPYITLNYPKVSIASALVKLKKSQINVAIKKQSGLSNNHKSLLKQWIVFLRQWLALVPDTTTLQIGKKELDKIEEFNPDVIYTLGGSINALDVSLRLSKKFNIPIIVHHMDNWMHSIQWERNPILTGYKNKLRALCKQCYLRTNIALAISERMASTFTEEFGVQHYPLMNSIDVRKYFCGDKEKSKPFRFAYAGGLHLNRHKALLEIAKVISDLEVELNIYTSTDNIKMYGDVFEKFTNVKMLAAVDHDSIMSIYKQSDALIHVESQALADNEFFKYSISTKIPEYLSTGRPVLFYGPENMYLYQLLRDNQIAYTASTSDELSRAIKAILNEDDATKNMVNNGRRYSLQHFDVSCAINTMKKVVDEACC